jgi:hypothetical protein
MKHSRHLRTTIGTTITMTAVSLVASAAFAGPAQANELCYSAGVSGTFTGTHNSPRPCVSIGLAILCTTPEAGLLPTVEVHAEACVPV